MVDSPTAKMHRHEANAGVIVETLVPDDVALVPQRKHEVVEAISLIALHDVPENRALTDLDHRFRLELRFLAQPGAESAAENQVFMRSAV